MTDLITHNGIVESINDHHIKVKIVQTSACSSCSARNHCLSSECKEKVIDIKTSDTSYSVGEEVQITGEMSMGVMAVSLAFAIPFLILVLSLFISMYFTGGNELLSACVALGLLSVYYIILSFNKDKTKRKFSFKINHINI